MPNITESSVIMGVKLVSLRPNSDDRGQFMEMFRKEWFPERRWAVVQCNRSDSAAGVLRGLHFHHKQVDYWQVSQGSVRVALADLRRSSATYGEVQVIDVDHATPVGIFIPIGIAHGFLASTVATLFYVVDNYYDGRDEHGIAWNDPTLGIDWGVSDPLLSDRDRQNRFLHNFPVGELPA